MQMKMMSVHSISKLTSLADQTDLQAQRALKKTSLVQNGEQKNKTFDFCFFNYNIETAKYRSND